MTVLIFPAGLAASKAYARSLRATGMRILGAASVSSDEATDEYDEWFTLPFIHEKGFDGELARLVADEGVERIFTPHAPTYLVLEQIARDGRLAVGLIGESPYQLQMADTVRRIEGGLSLARLAGSYVEDPKVSASFLGAIIDQAGHIYGECSHEKAVAICAIGSSAPSGDVVEIGSFFGKSAYVLDRVAAHFQLGATMAVDPWDLAASVQQDSPIAIQALSSVWDWDLVFKAFLINMQALASGRFNYVRAPSIEARRTYGEGVVISPEFGRTPLVGVISILHIDGNHDEAKVRSDFLQWSSVLATGGWIVFDDYEWSQGNGPRIVADEAVTGYGVRISHRFIAGGALFIKVN